MFSHYFFQGGQCDRAVFHSRTVQNTCNVSWGYISKADWGTVIVVLTNRRVDVVLKQCSYLFTSNAIQFFEISRLLNTMQMFKNYWIFSACNRNDNYVFFLEHFTIFYEASLIMVLKNLLSKDENCQQWSYLQHIYLCLGLEQTLISQFVDASAALFCLDTGNTSL